MKEREEIKVGTPAALLVDASGKEIPVYAQPEVQPEMTREEKKARLVSVLERGIVHDRLHVPLPPDIYGEWARMDPLEIARMQTLGFQIDYEYAQRRALHSDGTGAAVVGDVVFMTCPRETYEIIKEIRHEQFMRTNAPKKSKEEVELIANTFRDADGLVPTFSESNTDLAGRDHIVAALRTVDAQTQPAS